MNNKLVKTKKCSICKKEKPLSEFDKSALISDELKPFCKDCAVKLRGKLEAEEQKYLHNDKESEEYFSGIRIFLYYLNPKRGYYESKLAYILRLLGFIIATVIFLLYLTSRN